MKIKDCKAISIFRFFILICVHLRSSVVQIVFSRTGKGDERAKNFSGSGGDPVECFDFMQQIAADSGDRAKALHRRFQPVQ